MMMLHKLTYPPKHLDHVHIPLENVGKGTVTSKISQVSFNLMFFCLDGGDFGIWKPYIDLPSSSHTWQKIGGSSWWLNQPIWKIWVKLDHFCRVRDENKIYLKPPPSGRFSPPIYQTSPQEMAVFLKGGFQLTSGHSWLINGRYANHVSKSWDNPPSN